MKQVKLVECPRDAMQGLADFIPTSVKIEYLNQLLQCGFDTLDFGSFVSPKAIPQLADTKEVLKGLNLSGNTKLLAIVANGRGAQEAVQFDEISYIGYPFSVSETFQKRNTNTDLESALHVVDQIHSLCVTNDKELVVYLSMGFGNPYGEKWNPDLVASWCEKLVNEFGIVRLAPSDTIGCATSDTVNSLFSNLIKAFPGVKFGAHLHARKEHAEGLVQAAYLAGCRRFDGAILGFGGCPMAKDTLTGNMPTEVMLDYFRREGIEANIVENKSLKAQQLAQKMFNEYH